MKSLENLKKIAQDNLDRARDYFIQHKWDVIAQENYDAELETYLGISQSLEVMKSIKALRNQY